LNEQATSQIEAHIKDKRAELGSNLHALEKKVKSVTDWKQHFKNEANDDAGRRLWRWHSAGDDAGWAKEQAWRERFSPARNRTQEPTIKSTKP
jgi:hypothetical protein